MSPIHREAEVILTPDDGADTPLHGEYTAVLIFDLLEELQHYHGCLRLVPLSGLPEETSACHSEDELNVRASLLELLKLTPHPALGRRHPHEVGDDSSRFIEDRTGLCMAQHPR